MKRNRPKRRRDKYNPLPTHAGKRFSEPFHRNQIYEKDNRCYISFKDGQGDSREMEISRELFNEFDLFELEDISYLNKWDRHIEHSEIWDGSLNERAIYHTENVEDTVLKQEQLYEVRQAIRKLTEVQKRRLVMYFFEDMTYQEIARKEGVRTQVVAKSVKTAVGKLKKYLA